MRIADVRTFEVEGRVARTWPAQQWRIARPIDVYPEFRDEGPPAGGPGEARDDADTVHVRHAFVEIVSDDGPTGLYGPIEPVQAFLIATKLRPFLVGRDPLAGEALWDQMVRLDRHARSGAHMMAISAVDGALWDLRGKAFGSPVWRLLGGPTRRRVPAYASMLGFSQEPDALAGRAREYRDLGFTAQKWFFRYGRSSGREGLGANVALARRLREALGDGYPLMFDAWMSWDEPYAAEVARAIRPVDPKWLEEPLPPNRLDAFCRLRKAAGVPLAAGEHLYTRWQVKPFLDAGVLDYVQADPDWTGGVSELVRVCALASACGVPVVPHGHTLAAALHVVASQSPEVCPMVEYLIGHIPRQQCFFRSPPAPTDGFVEVPEGPGLGIELDETTFETRRELTW